MQRLGPACDLGTASDHFEATAERLHTSLKPFEGSVFKNFPASTCQSITFCGNFAPLSTAFTAGYAQATSGGALERNDVITMERIYRPQLCDNVSIFLPFLTPPSSWPTRPRSLENLPAPQVHMVASIVYLLRLIYTV
ncbi:hypothetical protein DFH08DRAFT_827352 [Mycena albidolilacea]|uniref:Uncharacterized protein n=1 Tax=Mycena albidolilacea TaxID=1033008 RepID=A0AAD7E7D7_9AGAR|nr:hypothetical protein DFH08DRAFT_827352 [Mycena albidolilacea]